jgi:hypothetical protein
MASPWASSAAWGGPQTGPANGMLRGAVGQGLESLGPIAGWYLGLDLAPSGLTAVLLNQLTGQSYPIYWCEARTLLSDSVGPVESGSHGANGSASRSIGSGSAIGSGTGSVDGAPVSNARWRLPTLAYLAPTAPVLPSAASQPSFALTPTLSSAMPLAQGWLLHDLPLALDLGLPYPATPDATGYSGAHVTGTGISTGISNTIAKDTAHGADPELAPELSEPQLNWFLSKGPRSGRMAPPAISLQTLIAGIQGLFSTLNPHRSAPWQGWADGLSPVAFQTLIQSLEGVVVSCPAGISEAYRFNVREALLGAGLVQRPEQIAFMEQAIAALMAEFHPQRSVGLGASAWPGGTLVIHAGEVSTELALTCLPQQLHNLNYEDIVLRSVPYGDYAFKQDLACQLLYPCIPEGQIDLHLTTLPMPGEPDSFVRSHLQRQLYQSPLGSMLLEAATSLYGVLQRQDRITFEFGPYSCLFSRAALDTKVIQPYTQRLNRELGRLLHQTSLDMTEIAQVVISGNGSTIPVIRQWLAQKLPQARIICDEMPDTDVDSDSLPQAPFLTERLAYGLVTLPIYPQVLDRHRQQYNDYFLLLELLRTLPDEPLALREIVKRLEARGVNMQACGDRVLQILEGSLPVGWVPEASELWTEASRDHGLYELLRNKPLFHQTAPDVYQPDRDQRQQVWQYWQRILGQSWQDLEEPYILQVGLSIVNPWA